MSSTVSWAQLSGEPILVGAETKRAENGVDLLGEIMSS